MEKGYDSVLLAFDGEEWSVHTPLQVGDWVRIKRTGQVGQIVPPLGYAWAVQISDVGTICAPFEMLEKISLLEALAHG